MGPCAAAQMLAHATLGEKYKFASACSAPWPCASGSCANGKDYDVCPEGWSSVEAGFCQITSGATSKCGDLYKFDDMPIADKQELALACGLTWPCKTACAEDYSQACPKGWSSIAGLCVAPATYAGDCGFSINTSGMSSAQKSEFGEKCGVQFPCVAA